MREFDNGGRHERLETIPFIIHIFRRENGVECIKNQGTQLEYDPRFRFPLIFAFFFVALRNRAEWIYFKYLNSILVRLGISSLVEAKKGQDTILRCLTWRLVANHDVRHSKEKKNLINDLHVEVFRMFL